MEAPGDPPKTSSWLVPSLRPECRALAPGSGRFQPYRVKGEGGPQGCAERWLYGGGVVLPSHMESTCPVFQAHLHTQPTNENMSVFCHSGVL